VSSDRSRRVWRNALTLSGAWLAAVALVFTLSLFFFDLLTPTPSPYIGVFTFLVLPILITVGVAMMVAGFLLKRRQLHRLYGHLSDVEYYPRIDLNEPGQQRVLAALASGGFVMVVFIGVMSYQGYHYTDSNDFCGNVCHAVMHPEHTAHQHSPHARVECTECHVGSGATHYFKAKLAGVRQVFAVAMDSYSRPLPAAITELRPAAETCEHCHWPQLYFGEQLLAKSRFASDESNTARSLALLMKTGGSRVLMGPSGGIHSHVSESQSIEFVALDEALQEIPWFLVSNLETGTSTVFRSDGLPNDAPPPDGIRRKMDCMDCHNRASHRYFTPADSADAALAAKPELLDLPYAKRQLVTALSTKYETREDGIAGVQAAIEAYYRDEHPDVVVTKPTEVATLAVIGREIYRRTVFPDMNVDWRSYPDNIGHLEFPGCFRCHAGQHVDAEKRAFRSECSNCHEFLVASADGAGVVRSSEFTHPFELEGVHAELNCDSCHTGGPIQEATCEGCHVDAVELMAGTSKKFERFEIEADAMDGLAECTDCHDLSSRMTSKSLNTACLGCHEDEDYAAPGTIARQRDEVAAKFAAVIADDEDTREILTLLRNAGPLHNFEAAKKILETLAHEGRATADNE
jgi:nitrate/TMAO reductase-like tetraheme cytochrome c subunit